MIIQILIAFTGVIAILLSQSKYANFRKYACIFGLLGQPLWFYTSYTHKQWGIFALCFFYTYAWSTGVYNNWICQLQHKT